MKNVIIAFVVLVMMVSSSFGQSELKVRKSTTGLTLLELVDNNKNVFLGKNSGEQANSFNGSNTGIGHWSLSLLSSGFSNTAVGNSALGGTRTGHNNVGIGHLALLNNNDGQWNTAVGSQSLLLNISGFSNVAIGNDALYSNLNNNNTAVGFEAGRSTEGSNNIFLGSLSGRNNDGSDNIFVGYNSGKDELGSNKLIIENSDADSTSALIYGEFDNDFLRFNGEVNINGAYSLPAISGTPTEILTVNAGNEVVWDTLVLMDQDSTNELIQIVSTGTNQLFIAEGETGHIVELKVDNLQDYDLDTKVVVDTDFNDDDHIRFIVEGKERLTMFRNDNGTMNLEIIDSLGNTAVGESALKSNDGGIGNTAFARNALRFNTDGIGNVALGRAAMQFSTTGDYNTYVGDLAGFRNDTGSFNVGVGRLALAENVNGEGNVGIGHFAGYHETGSNKLYVANDSVRFDEALIYGEFDNQLLRINGELNVNGDYSMPKDTGSIYQSMIMGPGNQLEWHREDIKFTNVEVEFGFVNTVHEKYIEMDTFTFTLNSLIQTPMIVDADDDTRIEVDNFIGNIDSDQIKFTIEGTEKYTIGNTDSGMAVIEQHNNEENILIGRSAGMNSTGGKNTFVGFKAGLSNVTGDFNTYIGKSAGENSIGHHNSVLGENSGTNNEGNFNSLFGNNAGWQLVGDENIIIGTDAGRKLEGDSNVVIGKLAGFDSNGSNNVFLGPSAGYYSSGNNRLYIENTDVDSTEALIYGEFDNNKLRINGDVGIGVNALYPIHINEANPIVKLANSSNQGTVTFATNNFWALRISNDMNTSSLGVDMTTETFEPYQNDTLTLGTASYKWKEVYATNATINTSDRRFKKNIENLSYGLETIMQMRPVSYQWKKEKNGRKINGFIAQEMEEIVPEIVEISNVRTSINKQESESEYSELYGMRYTELIPILTKAIQDQQAIIDDLTVQVESQNQKVLIDQLIRRIEALENE